MFKASKFNTNAESENSLLLFNALSKKYLKTISYKDLVFDILRDPDSYVENPVFNILKKYSFIVEDAINENEILQFKRNDYIYNSQLSVCILPTEQCNLRCVYCYEEFQHGNMSQQTQDSFILWLKRNIHKYTSVHVEWFGGEPLVAKEIIFSLSRKIIDICHRSRKPFTASITTNGTLMDLDTFRELLKCHVTSFQVTIDGVKETHDKLKIRHDGKGTYDTIINNLLSIKDQVKSSSSFKILVRTNVTLDVIEKMPQHLCELSNMFGNDRRFTFYFRPVGHWAEQKVFLFESSLISKFETLYSPILNSNAHINYDAYCSLLEDQVCSASKRNYFILRSNGNINKCTMLLNSEENMIGRLHDNGRMEIDYYKMQKWLSTGDIPNKCKNCQVAPTCYGISCPAKGFVLKNNDRCNYETKSLQYIMRLLDKCGIFEWIEN